VTTSVMLGTRQATARVPIVLAGVLRPERPHRQPALHRHQSQEGPGPRPHHPARAAAAGRPRHRV